MCLQIYRPWPRPLALRENENSKFNLQAIFVAKLYIIQAELLILHTFQYFYYFERVCVATAAATLISEVHNFDVYLLSQYSHKHIRQYTTQQTLFNWAVRLSKHKKRYEIAPCLGPHVNFHVWAQGTFSRPISKLSGLFSDN